MKFLIFFFLAVACVFAEPGISEWRAEYGSYPTGHVVKLKYEAPMLNYEAPILNYEAPIAKYEAPFPKYDAPILKYDAPILKYDAPMYYRLAPKAYALPAGYRVSYDPENFNEAFGFYPDYKK